MPEQPSDDILIEQAQRGELESFNALVLRYQDYCYSITYRIMGEPDSAADAVQDAFFTAYRKIRLFRGGNFKAWLARIAINTCYDELRKRKRRPQDYLEDMPGSDHADGTVIPANEPTPEQEAQRSDLQQAIQECISTLKDDQRMVLVLCDIQGMAYEEIAQSQEIALGTVKSRLSRARLAMRNCLQAVQELLPDEYRFES